MRSQRNESQLWLPDNSACMHNGLVVKMISIKTKPLKYNTYSAFEKRSNQRHYCRGDGLLVLGTVSDQCRVSVRSDWSQVGADYNLAFPFKPLASFPFFPNFGEGKGLSLRVIYTGFAVAWALIFFSRME